LKKGCKQPKHWLISLLFKRLPAMVLLAINIHHYHGAVLSLLIGVANDEQKIHNKQKSQ